MTNAPLRISGGNTPMTLTARQHAHSALIRKNPVPLLQATISLKLHNMEWSAV